jgi:hypothetical protein
LLRIARLDLQEKASEHKLRAPCVTLRRASDAMDKCIIALPRRQLWRRRTRPAFQLTQFG